MHGTRLGELPYEISKRTDFRSAESELSNYSRLVGQLGQPPDEFSPSAHRGRANSSGRCMPAMEGHRGQLWSQLRPTAVVG